MKTPCVFVTAETSLACRILMGLAGFFETAGLYSLSAHTLQYQWRRGVRSARMALDIANALLETGASAEAVVFFREACRRDATLAQARAGLVCALFRAGAVREAARHATILAASDPWAEVWVLVGELRKRVGDTVGSLDAFRRAARAPSAPAQFILGEGILGEEAWSNLVAPLASLLKARSAVGVGTHLVRGRATSVARAFSRQNDSAPLAIVATGEGLKRLRLLKA